MTTAIKIAEPYVDEVTNLIEAVYPIRDAKRFINTQTLITGISDQQPKLTKVCKRHQLRVCTLVMQYVWHWERYNTRGGGRCRGSVFVRPDMEMGV